MAYPTGVITRVTQAGPFLNSAGDPVSGTVRVVSATPLVWSATGAVIFSDPLPVPLNSTGVFSVYLPVNDQSGFIDQDGNALTGWTYTITFSLDKSISDPGDRTFSLITAAGPYIIAPDTSVEPTAGVVVVRGSDFDSSEIKNAANQAAISATDAAASVASIPAVMTAQVTDPTTDFGIALSETLEGYVGTANDPIVAELISDASSETGTTVRPLVQTQTRAVNAGRLYNPAKLARFAAARAREDITPAVITGLMHSIGWGIGSDDINGGMVDPNGLYRENAWPVILRKLFAREHNEVPAQNFLGFYPAYGVATLSTSPAPTFSTSIGPFDSYSSSGYAYGGYNLYTAGAATITIPATQAGRFTTIDVFYWGSDSGVTNPVRPKVTVDTTVLDSGTTTVVSGNLLWTRFTGISDTAHPFIVSHPGGSTNGCYSFAAVVHRGTGVIVNRIGAPGAVVANVAGAATGAARTRNLDASILAGYTNLLMIELDTNDIIAQTPIATWKTSMQEIIDRSQNSGACVLIVASPTNNGGELLAIPESAYRQAALDLSNSNAYTAFWDGSGVIGDRNQAVTDGLYPPASPTTVHPGTQGHKKFAQALYEVLPLPAGDYLGFTPGFMDSFNRADSATTLTTTDDGKTWNPLNSSVWGTIGNAAYCPTPGSSGYAVVASGSANGVLSTVMSVASDFCGLVLRAFDNNNNLIVERSGANLVIVEHAGGVTNTRATATGGAPANGDTISVEMNGTSLVVKKNGATLITYTSSLFATNTNHGLYAAQSSARYDSISFIPA